jgi:hypothetical protein
MVLMQLFTVYHNQNWKEQTASINVILEANTQHQILQH